MARAVAGAHRPMQLDLGRLAGVFTMVTGALARAAQCKQSRCFIRRIMRMVCRGLLLRPERIVQKYVRVLLRQNGDERFICNSVIKILCNLIRCGSMRWLDRVRLVSFRQRGWEHPALYL